MLTPYLQRRLEDNEEFSIEISCNAGMWYASWYDCAESLEEAVETVQIADSLEEALFAMEAAVKRLYPEAE